MKKFLFLFLSSLILLFIGCSDSCNKPVVPSSSNSNSSDCDTSLWKFVYHPYRLRVIKKCFTARGTIEEIRKEKDGDDHIRLKLDAGQDSLLNERNIKKQDGDLVVEVICINKILQPDAIEPCKNCPDKIQIPPIGSHVAVSGSYVIDEHHGWAEIHPATKMEIIP